MRWLVCSLLLLAACTSSKRVELRVPSPEAPFETRLEAYLQYKPEVELLYKADGVWVGRPLPDKTLPLVNGALISDPRDLAPLVEGEPVAEQIEEYEAAQERVSRRALVGLALVGVGGGALGVLSAPVLVPVAVLGFVGGGGSLLAAIPASRRMQRARKAVFLEYDQALRDRLGICVEKEEKIVFDCFRTDVKGRYVEVPAGEAP